MAKWELTDEEILAKSTDQFEYCELALEIGKWARDEQAKRLVEWGDEYCDDGHAIDMLNLGRQEQRRDCPVCWRKLCRQVGL